MATYAVPGTYSTVDSAVSAAAAANSGHGDYSAVIEVAAGTYSQSINLVQWEFARTAPITIRAADPNNKPVFDGTLLGNVGQAVRLNSANGFLATTERPRLENLVFQNWVSQTNGLIYCANGPTITITGCEFIDVAAVIRYLRGGSVGDRSLVEKCLFLRTGQAIHGGVGSDYALIRNNAFVDFSAVAIANLTAGWLVYSNSFYTTTSGLSAFVQAGDVVNNVGQQSGGSATRAWQAAGTKSNNVRYGTFSNSDIGTGTDATSGNPLFVSPSTGDLTWTSGSSCDDVGTTLSDVTADYFGTARPQGVNPDAGNFTITPTDGGVAVTVQSAAASGNPGSSITLTTTEHTDGKAYNVAWAGVLNVVDGDDDYTGEGDFPTISSAVMTAPHTIRVTFSEAMLNEAALTDVGNYEVRPTGGTPFTPASVTRISSTVVDVTPGQSITRTSGQLYADGPRDIAHNLVVDEAPFTTYETAVSGIEAAVGEDGPYIALFLSDSTYVDSGSWSDLGNVEVTSGAGAIPSLTAGLSGPYALFWLSGEMTIGAAYTFAWSGLVGVANGSLPFVGVGVSPTIEDAAPSGPYQFSVTFSEDMKDDAELVDVGNYTVTSALHNPAVTTVVRINATIVVVIIDGLLIPGLEYTVGVAGPTDFASNPVNDDFAFFGTNTSVSAAIAPSADKVTVTFGQPIATTDALLNPSSWLLSPGLWAVSVENVEGDEGTSSAVVLSTTPQVTGLTYAVYPHEVPGLTEVPANFTGVGSYNHVGGTTPTPQGRWGG